MSVHTTGDKSLAFRVPMSAANEIELGSIRTNQLAKLIFVFAGHLSVLTTRVVW